MDLSWILMYKYSHSSYSWFAEEINLNMGEFEQVRYTGFTDFKSLYHTYLCKRVQQYKNVIIAGVPFKRALI